MRQDRVEWKWIQAFARTFELCGLRAGDPVVILSESLSRAVNVQIAELALLHLGARPFHIVLPTPPQEAPVPVRSTGASHAIGNLSPVIGALGSAVLVVDLTVEGLLHAEETPAILARGARILMISNEHPEVLERLVPDPALRPQVEQGAALLQGARKMHVTSEAGTDLAVNIEGARIGSGWGYTDQPGTITYWPGGLCACVPRSNSTNGTLVLATGDVNLTFKRYVEKPIALTIESDFVTAVEGEGLDADLMRSYFAAWNDRNAYAVSHIGWGMNPRARWDALIMYDKADVNGTELRAFAGNFLYSTGANAFANRHTIGHFDLPMRNTTIALDGYVVVDRGVLTGDLAP